MGTYLDDVGFALTLTNLKPKFDALAEQIGNLDQLDTTAKTNLVEAINEVNSGCIKSFTGTDINDLKTQGVYISDEQKLHLPSGDIGYWLIIVTGGISSNTQYAFPPDNATLYYRTLSSGETEWDEWKSFAKMNDVTDITGALSDLTTTAKTNLVAAVNEVLATANKKLDLIQLEPTSTSATVDIPTGGCVLVVTANHTVTLTFNGNAGDLVILVNNTTGNIRNFALSPVLPSNNIAVILMDGEHAGQSLFRTDVIPDSVAEVTGELNNLTTTSKTNLVAAINEVANSSGGFEDLGNVDIGTDGLPAIPYTGASRDGIYTFTCSVKGFLFSTNSGTSFWDVMIYKDNVYTRMYSDVPLPPPTWTIVGSSGRSFAKNAEIGITTKTCESSNSTDMSLISNLPIYTTDGGQIEYSGVFDDDKEVIPLINLILKWGTKTYKTTLFQSRYQPSSDTNGHIHQMLYWNNGGTGIVPITRSIEINNQNETYWGVWTDCNGKEYSDLA